MASDTLVHGPAWSSPGLAIAAGRFPLAVERHVLRLVDLLVPGVTTVTPHARYYALHGLIGAESAARDLDVNATRDLLRRCEVVMAAASYRHSHPGTGLAKAHGLDALAGRLSTGQLDLARDSQSGPDGYVRNAWGFWAPYIGSELTLGILANARVPAPGPALNAAALRDGLGGILDLARQATLDVAAMDAYPHLCVCGGRTRADGPWLAGLLHPAAAASGSGDDANGGSAIASRDRTNTIALLGRLLDLLEVHNVTTDLVPHLAFGDLLSSDPALAENPVASAWRGVTLRNYSVGAWRRLWSWLVAEVQPGITPRSAVGDALADALPNITVRALFDDLPDSLLPSGAPAAAEQQLRDSNDPLPLREIKVLAANSRRVHELEPSTLHAFLGEFRGADLAPEWTGLRLQANLDRPLRDVARELAVDLLARAQRVALSKARRREDGTVWLPTRLHERGDLLFKTSEEGRGDVGLRLPQLLSVCAGAGLFDYDTTLGWSVSDLGRLHLA